MYASKMVYTMQLHMKVVVHTTEREELFNQWFLKVNDGDSEQREISIVHEA